ncbi:MAG: cation diffusion facilitator family transporter [Acidimicrobiales bacterium]
MSHDHSHHGTGGVRAGARYRRRLSLAFAVIATFFVVEAIGGLVTGSLALLSDAGHMLTDVVGLGMALAAIHLASHTSDNPQRTFGLYRLEILAAMANAVLLFGVAGWVLIEAGSRFGDPPDVPSGAVIVVALVGLGANVVAFRLLREGAKDSLNVEGAYLEVLSDLLGSVAVVVAAGIIAATGWTIVDPIAAAGIGLFIVPRTWKLAAQALRILMQAAPPHVDLGTVRAELAALPGVVDVHDLHLWTLTSDMEVASAHLMVSTGTNAHAVLDAARELLRTRYSVAHATLQVEPDDHTGCEEIDW